VAPGRDLGDPGIPGRDPAGRTVRYAIEFADDGTFSARADCNILLGTFTVEGSDGITLTPGPSTLVACRDGSYGSLFAHALSAVTTWSLEEYELTLTTADGGGHSSSDRRSSADTAPTLCDAEPAADPDAVSDARPRRRRPSRRHRLFADT
jgi:heat shock protein HslJ